MRTVVFSELPKALEIRILEIHMIGETNLCRIALQSIGILATSFSSDLDSSGRRSVKAWITATARSNMFFEFGEGDGDDPDLSRRSKNLPGMNPHSCRMTIPSC